MGDRWGAEGGGGSPRRERGVGRESRRGGEGGRRREGGGRLSGERGERGATEAGQGGVRRREGGGEEGLAKGEGVDAKSMSCAPLSPRKRPELTLR